MIFETQMDFILFLLHFPLVFSVLYEGETQTANTSDWTTSIPNNLLLEQNQTWRLVNCTYDFEDDPLLESQEVSVDYITNKKRKGNQTNNSRSNVNNHIPTKIDSGYNSANKRPTLVEALTNGKKHPLRIFWALFSQLSTMTDLPDEERLDKRNRQCSPRGTIFDSHVTLCPFCRVRTKLPLGHIPPYIDEVICEQTNVACFRKQGKCFQRYMKITALRKIRGSHCLLSDETGRQFWTGNWEIYDQKVRVSCECLLDKRSKFVKYAIGSK